MIIIFFITYKTDIPHVRLFLIILHMFNPGCASSIFSKINLVLYLLHVVIMLYNEAFIL